MMKIEKTRLLKMRVIAFIIILIASLNLTGCKTPEHQNKDEIVNLLKKMDRQAKYKKYRTYATAPEKLSAEEKHKIDKELAEPKKIVNHVSKKAEFMSAGYELGFFNRDNYPGKMFIFKPNNLKGRRILINKFTFPQEKIKQSSWQEYLEHRENSMGHLELKKERAEIEETEHLKNEHGSALYIKGSTINYDKAAFFMNFIYLTDKPENSARQVRYHSGFELSDDEVNSFKNYVDKIANF